MKPYTLIKLMVVFSLLLTVLLFVASIVFIMPLLSVVALACLIYAGCWDIDRRKMKEKLRAIEEMDFLNNDLYERTN